MLVNFGLRGAVWWDLRIADALIFFLADRGGFNADTVSAYTNCPRERLALSHWCFIVRHIVAYCGMLRRKQSNMPRDAGVNAIYNAAYNRPTP